ncbi:MAG: RtcB family protein [Bacteroidales bacterium]
MKKGRITNKELKHLGINHPDMLVAVSKEANDLLKKRKTTKQQLLGFIDAAMLGSDSSDAQDDTLDELNRIIRKFLKNNPKEPLQVKSIRDVSLRSSPLPYPVFGKDYIESGAIEQMERAMSLPIACAGALMPDAHQGYGLPIGGVLATEQNTVIPYAVGVDIACRMCMSVYPVNTEYIERRRFRLREMLEEHTVFGVGAKSKSHLSNEVFDKHDWGATKFIRQHRDLAYSQLGTSGAGNHFVEWGELSVIKDAPEVTLKRGDYLALLSHSGSRGFGNEVASYYSKVAMARINLPKEARHLAWLNLAEQEGHEYWVAMNLAGEYASANHHEIHGKISREFGEHPLTKIESHHNFAWKEKLLNGKHVVIHRKGATPAGEGAIGIVPGSMTHPGFVVRGKGSAKSLNSASHGAGRIMSRSKALKTFTKSDLENILLKHKVELVGGDIDEIPFAYKDIETVMGLQNELVEIIAVFQPRIVRMADGDRRRRRR